jgi:hypothetical protein
MMVDWVKKYVKKEVCVMETAFGLKLCRPIGNAHPKLMEIDSDCLVMEDGTVYRLSAVIAVEPPEKK